MTLPGRKAEFLKYFAKTGNQSESLAVAGLAKSTHYKLLENNPKYTEAFETACDVATDQLIEEVTRRAVQGVPEPTGFYKGVAGGVVTRYSDSLLMALLKQRDPSFRERWEVTGAGGRSLQISVAAYQPPEVPEKGYSGPAIPSKSSEQLDPGAGAGPVVEVEVNDVSE